MIESKKIRINTDGAQIGNGHVTFSGKILKVEFEGGSGIPTGPGTLDTTVYIMDEGKTDPTVSADRLETVASVANLDRDAQTVRYPRVVATDEAGNALAAGTNENAPFVTTRGVAVNVVQGGVSQTDAVIVEIVYEM